VVGAVEQPVSAHEHGLRPSDVVRRTVRGAMSLGGGQVAAQLLNIGGAILLARLLTPAEFGLVAIFTFFLAFLTALGDLGLGMSLVRQPAEPSDAEYRAVSSFQQAVAIGGAFAALAATPWVVRAYGLAPGAWWLLPIMALAILADSIRFQPLVRLERRLAFERVGAVEITQAIVFNSVLLSLAVSGFRTTCFPIAVVARSSAGMLLALALGPRSAGWSWHWPTARHHLRIGFPYQGVHLITVLRNSLVPLFVGLLLGRASVGRLEWAAMMAGFPLTGLILLQRLYVGSFSRMRAHPDDLRVLVTRMLSVAHALVAPAAVVTLVLIDPVVRLVFGDVWLGAIPLARWLWPGCLVMPTLAPLIGLLHAFGRSRVVLGAGLVAMLATWVVGVPLALTFGEAGAAAASLAAHAAGLVIWRTARGEVDFRVFRPAIRIWICAAPAGAVAWWWHTAFPRQSIPELLLCGGAATAAYAVTLAVCGPATIRPSSGWTAPYWPRRLAAGFRSPGS
jgi:O-antigen/teichoic acid export membrane protein